MTDERKLRAICVRGETVHPDCTTTEECLITVMLLFEVPEGACGRCGKPFAEQPS